VHCFVVGDFAVLINLVKLNEFLPWVIELFLRRYKGNQCAQAQLALADVAYAPGTRFLLEGHVANRVYDLSLSPDDSRALSGAVDRSMILWDMETGLPIQQLTG